MDKEILNAWLEEIINLEKRVGNKVDAFSFIEQKLAEQEGK